MLRGRFGFFFRSGREKGESEAPGGGGGSGFIENYRRGGGFPGGVRGREGVCGELRNLRRGGGGGLNIFFGTETSTK